MCSFSRGSTTLVACGVGAADDDAYQSLSPGWLHTAGIVFLHCCCQPLDKQRKRESCVCMCVCGVGAAADDAYQSLSPGWLHTAGTVFLLRCHKPPDKRGKRERVVCGRKGREGR